MSFIFQYRYFACESFSQFDSLTLPTIVDFHDEDATGLLVSLKNEKSGIKTPFSIDFGFYNSSTGGCTDGLVPKPAGGYPKDSYVCDAQKSGAYMFRPNSSKVSLFTVTF